MVHRHRNQELTAGGEEREERESEREREDFGSRVAHKISAPAAAEASEFLVQRTLTP